MRSGETKIGIQKQPTQNLISKILIQQKIDFALAVYYRNITIRCTNRYGQSFTLQKFVKFITNYNLNLT